MLAGVYSGLWTHVRTGLVFAENEVPHDFWERLWGGFVLAVVYGLLGIALMVLGFKVFDWISPRLDIQKELGEKNNLAVAIVCAAVILAVALIVAVVIN
jgi:putative membrane protein